MKEKDLIFDRKKHVIYTPKAKKVIQSLLRRYYPLEEAERLWEDIQQEVYSIFMGEFDVLGKILNLNRRLDLKLAAQICSGLL